MRKARQDAEVEMMQAELDEIRPYLDVAREIHHEVARLAADPDASAEMIADVFERLPRQARIDAVAAAFGRPVRRPAVGHPQSSLRRRRPARRPRAGATRPHRRQPAAMRDGLPSSRASSLATPSTRVRWRRTSSSRSASFREVDVQSALAQGRSSSTCARRLVLRGTDDAGVLLVVEDVFNPARGLFVTADYDERTWRDERLSAHALVRLGSIRDGADDGARRVRPVDLSGRARRRRLGRDAAARIAARRLRTRRRNRTLRRTVAMKCTQLSAPPLATRIRAEEARSP